MTHRHGTLLDVTATRPLEQESLQSQRLAAIGEMAAMMAHEIRNPLAGMALALRALRPIVGDHAEGKECLDDLDRCVKRIDETVSRALDFARARPPSPRPCSLAQVVAAATQFTLPSLRRQRVELVADVPDGLPPLLADPAQLEQVFVQLILNACKAMPQGGTLTVRARGAERGLVAEVADTGVGIAKERLDHIFTPFYSSFGEGSGLGLSLCQRIIAAHQGTLHVESTQGKGTLFRIELPLEPAHATRAAR